MKKITLFLILVLIGFSGLSQTYCNEWISYNQQYAKFPIIREGLYRIDSATLAQKFNLSNLNPKNLQLFIKGKEQALYIFGDADDKINTGDYVEFYADGLIGDIDSLIYHNIKYVPNPYAPVFSDTLFAFLTFNNSINNKRYSLETDTNAIAYPNPPYVYTSVLHSMKNFYNRHPLDVNDANDPAYTQTDGWGGAAYHWGGGAPVSITTTFTALQPFNTSSVTLPVFISYAGSGNSETVAPIDHRLVVNYFDINNNPILLKDISFKGYAPFRMTHTVDVRSLGQNSNFNLATGTITGFPNLNQALLFGYLSMVYPRTLNLNNKTYFKFVSDDASNANKNFYNFTTFNLTNSSACIAYDLTNSRRIVTKINGNNVRMVVPNGNGSKVCVMAGDSNFIKVTKIFTAGKNGSFVKHNISNLSKPYIMVYHPKLFASANTYKDYRKSVQGGTYDVILEDVTALYDQYCYGVPRHPMALRNFFKFLNDSLTSKPQYILLLGKGLRFDYVRSAASQNLIPTMGYHSADAMLSAALSKNNNEIYVPEIPIGRVAATNNAELDIYLNKVREREIIDTAFWKKKVLHFVGGDDESLNRTLGRYMDNMASIIKDTLFGAKVLTFVKNTTAPIQTNINDSIYRIINQGASLINFFGHGSAAGFDQGVDDPTKYNNQPNYPFLLGNSCHAGELFELGIRSVNENFLFTDRKGSIGALSTVAYAFDNHLNEYSTNFYKALTGNKYGLGVGDAIKEAVFQTNKTNDSILKYLTVNMTLHGDPAIKIFPGEKPDYILKNYNVNFDLKKYTDSIGIQIITINNAKAIRDSIGIRVRRYFPNGDTLSMIKKVKAPLNRDTLLFYTAIDFKRGFGLNEFEVNIDYQNKIQELNENNNASGRLNLFIPGGDIFPIYPYKFAVVPKTNKIVLKASTTDPFSPTFTYRFQLDTCDKFISPIQTTIINSKGGVLEWEVNLPFADSTVYFWRVSKDSTSSSAFFNWRESSFQTIGSKNGWAQSHFHQFKSNSFKYIDYRKTERLFTFNNTVNSIVARSIFADNGADYAKNTYFFNGNKMDDYACLAGGWNFAVFDSITNEPDYVKSLTYPSGGLGTYNNCICYNDQIRRVYTFGKAGGNGFPCPSANWKTDVENFLNSIPTGKYVLGYSLLYINNSFLADYSTYSNSLYNAFEKFGVSKIRTAKDTVPFIFFGRKGLAIGQAHETVGALRRQLIEQKDSLKTKFSMGYIASEPIGPSYKWNSLHWSVRRLETKPGDRTILKLVGIHSSGRADTLVTFPQDSASVFNLERYVKAENYPYLKLVAIVEDYKNLTAPQLRNWQILYDEAPECAINPLKGFASINDTLQEGDQVTFRFPIENVGIKSFKDSLLFTYWIEDKTHNKIALPNKYSSKAFLPGELIIDTVKVNSFQLNGENVLWININPINNQRYQKEQFQFNNIARFPFQVNKDITNPLLDVTFDGVRILNGDLVSAKPNILISLKDENKFLALNDTSVFSVSIKAPNQSTAQALYFARDLEFTPANLPHNSANILYNPNLTTDGKYTLFVKAKDRSNNLSGTKDYQVDFEVNNKPSITGVLNYPNPFTTATRFVFTLTGSEIPEVFTIRIMTITGKIVREITRAELGNLRIGRNITEFAWDGKDNYGDKLANGVYLYKVITKLNGQSLDKNASGADTYFTKEFGKMVIMR